MKIKAENYVSTLTASTVDDFSDKVRTFLIKLKLPNRDVVRYTMTLEEIMLKSMDRFDENTPVKLNMGSRFFRVFISLEIEGEAYNVFSEKDEEQSFFSVSILKNLGLSPEYTFNKNKNEYSFKVKKKSLNPFVQLVIAIVAAVAVGALGFVLPDVVRNTALELALNPLHDTFFNILGCIAGPMVFLSVAWGIYGIGDAATLKRIGKKMMLNYVGTVYVIVVIFSLAIIPFLNLNFTSTVEKGSQLSAIISMLLGIIPKNIFSPFVDGNTLQIIFLAIVIGIAMLFLGQKTTAVAKAVEQINYIVQFLIEFISKLVPYFIFVVLLKMIWADTASVLINVGKVFVYFIPIVIIMAIGVISFTAISNKISPLLLIKKGIPTFIIALTTASSAAAFGTNMNACKRGYGIDDKISSFGIPFGMIAFKPSTALNYMVAAMFFANMYKVEISASWIVMMILSVGILALATPPIPGGSMTAYTVLFTQLGIPPQAIALVLACDALFDFIGTGFDQFLLPMALLNQSNKMGLVKREILMSKNTLRKKKTTQ